MKNDIYSKIYDAVYKKSNLESMLINLETLKSKLEGTKKATKSKVEEIIEKNITNAQLKEILQKEVSEDNLAVFSDNSLASLVAKIQDMTNICKLIDVTLAVPLTEPDIKDLAETLEKKFNKKTIVNIKVDPSLIGGLVVKENKYIFDASLKSHLHNYENEWMKSLKKTRKKMNPQEQIPEQG